MNMFQDTSLGKVWVNIANIDLELSAGTHILGMYLTMDCSKKDTQHVYIYQWKNTITLK